MPFARHREAGASSPPSAAAHSSTPDLALLEQQIRSINRFPDQNPHPVMRISPAGELLYANEASATIRAALGAEVGAVLPEPVLGELLKAARTPERDTVEIEHAHQTYAILAVDVPDLGVINLYGTDITAQMVVAKFPDQNPNPVLRIRPSGELLYHNAASELIVSELGLRRGERIPEQLMEAIERRLADDQLPPFEQPAGDRVFAIKPVHVREFDFVNLYGTDITAEKVVAKFPDQNPNPVLRVRPSGELLYHNAASQPIVTQLGLRRGVPIPSALMDEIEQRLSAANPAPLEQAAADHVFELTPVFLREFGFINIYGTDVTAARQLAEAHAMNQRLLLNILPSPIADRLLAGERVIADRFEDVTLLFADIVDFTIMSSRMSANEVVQFLNVFFSLTDELADRFGLEKIKTVGDAYMVVGGLPEASADHTARVAEMALALTAELRGMKGSAGQAISCRMGIHFGPAVAGVIGTKKFIYDVWGDTVNTASRMESHGVPDRIQVTRPVLDRLGERYRFERRGLVDVKGKGPMETWFLLGRA